MQRQARLGYCLLVVFCLFLMVCPTVLSRPVPQDSTSVPVTAGDARPLLGQITSELLQGYLGRLCAFGPRYAGTVSCNVASEYIHDAFAAMGLAVEYHNWKYDRITSRDVVATLPGTLPDSQGVYIVCGHYDTVKVSPGADDDGSGAMAVLAIADALRDQHLNHTVRFITFSGEERGTYGSYTYAREAEARGDNIIAVLNMDMVGYANTSVGGRILRFYPPTRSAWIAQYATEISGKYHDVVDLSIETRPNYRGSDHQAFVDYGYDAVWIAHYDGYPWGHSKNDNISHINWSYYVTVARFMCALTWEIAMRPLPVQVILTAPDEGRLYLLNRSVSALDFGKQWTSELRGITVIFGRTMARAEVISSEPVAYVVFCIDGDFQLWDSAPPYAWKVWGWFFPIFGRHTLQVFAYTTGGHVAYDEMDLFVFSVTDTLFGHG